MIARPLPDGGTIGVIATGSGVERTRFEAGCAELTRRGFQIVSPFNPCTNFQSTQSFVSESIEVRAAALMELALNNKVDAIIAARGGYGTLELLPFLDFDSIAQSGKAIVGYSDLTPLLVHLGVLWQAPAIHGAMVGAEFANAQTDQDAMESCDRLISMLQNPEAESTHSVSMLREGQGEGFLVPANLSTLLTLLGTPWDVDLTHAILVLEDISEYPYRIYRALTHLKLAGKLDNLSGLVFGSFSHCSSPNGPNFEMLLELVTRDLLAETRYPIARNLPVGHIGLNIPLPIGAPAKLSDGMLNIFPAFIEEDE